jgi:hypothetical protein
MPTYGPRPPFPGQNGYAAPYQPPNPAAQRNYAFVLSPYQNSHGSPPPQLSSPAYPPPLQPGQQWGYPPPPLPQNPVQRPGSSHQQNGSFNGSFTNGYGQHQQVYPATHSSSVQNGRPQSSEGVSLPTSSGYVNGQQTPAARLPSPVVNRPIITPSQGNYDVGPVAGIPQYNHHEGPQSLHGGTPTPSLGPRSNGPGSSPTFSGVSPVKHAPSVPGSVSGTPVFPPAAKLAPSPEAGPVPTPTKHETPQEQRAS